MPSHLKKLLPLVLAVSLVCGCAQTGGDARRESEAAARAYVDAVALETVSIEEEAVALAATVAAVDASLTPVASGKLVQQSSQAAIDYSNTADGYVMAKFTAGTDKKIKAQVKGPTGVTYTYNLTPAADWTVFPLSDGNGSYKVTVFENVSGTKYSAVTSVTFSVTLADEFAPFLRPNQYVDYAAAPNTVAKGAELTQGLTDPLEKVKAVYTYVVGAISYDKTKAASVKSGYLPVLDTVLKEKTGICFDYAAVMTAMLRSQGVPCKLVVGYAGTAYHSWISVWSETDGWINAAIYFDGDTWQRMDPTFASSGKESGSIMKYIGDGSHYTAKYLY